MSEGSRGDQPGKLTKNVRGIKGTDPEGFYSPGKLTKNVSFALNFLNGGGGEGSGGGD